MNATPDPKPGPDNGALVQRVLYMLVFAVAFWILCWVLALSAIAQLLLRLVNGRTSAELGRFGAMLAAWTRQVVEYLTFASDVPPFPFTDWPQSATPRVTHEAREPGASS